MNLRAFGILVYVIQFLITTFPLRHRLKKLQKTDPQKAFAMAYSKVGKAFRGILSISGVRVETEGLEHIPEEACLYVGNHCSYFDIITTGTVIPSGAGYVAKDNLKKVPGLSAWMTLIHCLFLNRTNIKEGMKTILTGADYLKEGYSMFIFPEGTRHPEGDMGDFKGGSLKMAQRADAPIVPVAISGSRAVFEANDGLRVKPGIVRISFGKPFKISDLSKEKKKFAAEYAKEAIEEMLLSQKQREA